MDPAGTGDLWELVIVPFDGIPALHNMSKIVFSPYSELGKRDYG